MKADDLAQVQVDMTPMIDMVFQLIIFFMLVNRMVQDERAQLELPLAEQAKEEKLGDTKRMIINVHKDGKVEVTGRVVSEAELTKMLFQESRLSKDEDGASARSVLIRGDIDTPYKSIQKIMVECARQKLYKISFAAKIK